MRGSLLMESTIDIGSGEPSASKQVDKQVHCCPAEHSRVPVQATINCNLSCSACLCCMISHRGTACRGCVTSGFCYFPVERSAPGRPVHSSPRRVSPAAESLLSFLSSQIKNGSRSPLLCPEGTHPCLSPCPQRCARGSSSWQAHMAAQPDPSRTPEGRDGRRLRYAIGGKIAGSAIELGDR
jgi:hypothetical protein